MSREFYVPRFTSLAPGLYNLLSVFAYESGNHGGAMSSAGILRVIAAP